jgi:FSR family fosmidomycin resistance protein-like MFS transporter
MDDVLDPPPAVAKRPTNTVFALLFAISIAHMLNDTIQALLPSIYPLLKASYALNYAQIGLITCTFQVTAAVLQPVVGFYTDGRPMPYSLAMGMGLTFTGLLFLSRASSFPLILLSAAMIGSGSAIFHPEASRIAYMAAGKRRGLAQSLFQVGGNLGTSFGPLLAAGFIVAHGQQSLAGFSVLALIGVCILVQVGRWQGRNLDRIQKKPRPAELRQSSHPSRKTVTWSVLVLVVLTFSKYVYLHSITSYYTLYLMDRFGVGVQQSQHYLFLFLFAVAAGTILGGPIGDRIGRKRVIWGSILGVAPFTLWLPHADLATTAVLSVIIGVILASAFSAILVYAQELMPGKVGMVAGLFFGLAFGIGGIGAAVLGKVADITSINFVFHICAFLPLLGIFTIFLPDLHKKKIREA